MKRRIWMCAVVAIGFSILASGTGAYFTAEEKVHNVITTGNVDIDLIEKTDFDSDGDGELDDFENVSSVTPGTEVSKIVTVKNTGGQPAWVRIKVEKSITLADGVIGEIDESLISYDINTEYWIEQGDYYYYTEALAPGATTEPLFSKVSFAPEMGNLYQNCTVAIDVQAQATQVANNGTTVLEADGWPADELK